MIRWNLFFEVEKVEQLALIDRLATHHHRPPSLKASGKRNHDSSISTRPFSTGSTHCGHKPDRSPVAQQPPAASRYAVVIRHTDGADRRLRSSLLMAPTKSCSWVEPMSRVTAVTRRSAGLLPR